MSDEPAATEPQGGDESDAVAVTMENLLQIGQGIRDHLTELASEHDRLLAAVDEETRLAVTAQVMRAIVDHAAEGGSFRYLIYDRLGFGFEAYVPLYNAGGMTISNEFTLGGLTGEPQLRGEKLLRAFGYGSGQRLTTVTLEGGKEPWMTLCTAAHALDDMEKLLLEAPHRAQRAANEAAEAAKILAALHAAVRMREAHRNFKQQLRLPVTNDTSNDDCNTAIDVWRAAIDEFDRLAAEALATSPQPKEAPL